MKYDTINVKMEYDSEGVSFNPYIISDKKELDNIIMDNNIIKKKCAKGLHFPQHIYEWRIPELNKSFYGAHCAICGTDYTIKELDNLTKR